MMQPLFVLGAGSIVPATSADTKLDLGLLERSLRRGLSDVTRLFMHAAKLALDQAALPASGMQVVFASAFGEIAVAEALLAEAYDADSSSPARFRNSVHNTAPGLFSISQRDTLPSTAIAAGWDTVAMGLLECSAQLAQGAEHVLLVFAEERVPHSFSPDHPHPQLGAAFVLAGRGPARAALRGLRRESSPAELDGHPLAGALALAHMIERGRSGVIALSDGDTPWCVTVESPP